MFALEADSSLMLAPVVCEGSISGILVTLFHCFFDNCDRVSIVGPRATGVLI